MTILFGVGFEAGSSAEVFAVSGTNSFSSSVKRTGSYSFRTNPATTGAGYGQLLPVSNSGQFASANIATVWFGTAFRAATLPASDDEPILIVLTTGSAQKIEIRITSGGLLRLYNAAGTLVVTGTTALSLDTWYYIEVQCGSSATVGDYDVRINGVSEFSGTTNTSATNVGGVRVGKHVDRSGQTVDFYYDDCYMDNAAFQATTSAFPEVRVLLPNAAGDSAGWTNGTGLTFAEVDEVPPESDGTDASYIQASATEDTLYSTFAVEDTATKGVVGTILAVTGFVWAKTASSSGTSAVSIRVRSNTTNSDSTGTELTTSYQARHRMLVTDPATGSAWTSGGVDAVQVGMVAGTIEQTQRFSAAYIFVLALVSSPISVTPSPISMPLVTVTPALQRTTLPSPVTMPLALTTPVLISARTVTPDAVTMPFLTTTPLLKRGTAPNPVPMPLVTASPSVFNEGLVLLNPVSIPFTLTTPGLKSTVRPDPTSILFQLTTPTLRNTIHLDPVTLTLTLTTPGLVTTLAPGAVALILTTPTPQIGVAAVLPTPAIFLFILPDIGLIFPARFVPNAIAFPTRNPPAGIARPIYP